ncbi:MAG: DNA polymerase Y family protein [Phycisphaerales bacterium]|nr:DNA polymerase Y family protein [Phycisphaerales bacterium]
MKRSMCLYIPYLPLERLKTEYRSRRASGAESDHRPGNGSAPDEAAWVVTRPRGGVVRVVRCDASAARGGVRAGMTLAEANTLMPDLRAEPHDAEADAAALRALAGWAHAFSPVVHVEDDESLILDVTGCARLFRGEVNLLRQALDGLRDRGFSARGAIADTPGAAWAMAHAHDEPAVVTQPGRDVEDLLRLPAAALRIDGRTAAALHRVGVETIEGVIYLPRASLGARFGADLLRRLDQALGNVAEVLTPFRPAAMVRVAFPFGGATDRLDTVQEAMGRVLASFCEELGRQVAGVTRWHAAFCHPDGPPTVLTVEASRPTRDARRLHRLLAMRLERSPLRGKTDGLIVWTRDAEPLDGAQQGLFDMEVDEADALADLVDRLSARLGSGSVSGVALVDDHQPERGYVLGEGTKGHRDEGTKGERGNAETLKRRDAEMGREGDGGISLHGERVGAFDHRDPTHRCATDGAPTLEARNWKLETRSGARAFKVPEAGTGGRPMCVMAAPVEVPVTAVAPEGPPARFRWRSAEHEVASCVGPERVETGWWRGREVRRDYFRVVSTTGQAFWLFREGGSGRWYVHGVFD